MAHEPELIRRMTEVIDQEYGYNHPSSGDAARALLDSGIVVPASERRGLELTAREIEALAEVGRGVTQAAAAASLGTTTTALEHRLVSVRKKLDVGSTSEALAVARRRGLVS